MGTVCCSNECEKKFECAKHCLNVKGDCCVEDFSHFGTCTYTDNGCEVNHWCGESGNYKMFEPVSKRMSVDELVEKFYKVNVNILDENGNFRSTLDVLEDLAAIWFKE